MSMAMRYTPSVRPGRGRARAILLGLALLPCTFRLALSAPPKPATLDPATNRKWQLIERVITQDQGDWQVDYRLKLDAPAAVVLAPTDLGASIDGWVSNSSVPVHAVPKRSTPKVSGTGSAAFEVILSPDDAKTCRERLVMRAWPALGPEPAARAKTTPASAPDPLPPVTIAPGSTLCVRLRLEHEHFLYGPYDPMLGVRTVELKLGPNTLRDSLPLDRQHAHVQAKEAWPQPPEDRRDTQHFVSAPDSLHLEAHVPGNQYYRFSEKPVRYNTKMKLTFWYLIAPGTEGDFRVRIAQYKDSPSGWQVLHQGACEQTYTKIGRWTKVERIIKTEAEATSLAIDFRIYGAEEVGEVWIDDVSLDPIGATPERP